MYGCMFCVLLFNFVSYVFLLYLCIFIARYVFLLLLLYILLVILCILIFMFMYSYYNVYVFLLLCMFRSMYSVSLCRSVYCLCVNVYCTAATGHPIAVNHIY